MTIKKKYFLIGFLVGFLVLPLAVATIGGGLIWYHYNDILVLAEQELDKVIEEPPIPTVLGTTDVDYNWQLKSINNETAIVMEQFRGETLFINVWATWCLPCIVEMKHIQRLYDKTNSEVSFIVVSDESLETVQNFLKNKNYTFPVYVSGGPLPTVFKKGAIPSTFVVSPSGKIVFEHTGSAKWNSEKFISFLFQVAQSVR